MPIKVSIVSYYNTIPFMYGIETYEKERDQSVFLVQKDYPSKCAEALITGQVDIALVPVATLCENSNLELVTDYCIGADGAVDSVLLLSDDPIESLSEVILDYQSKTSNNLYKVLAKHYWKVSPNTLVGSEGYELDKKAGRGVIVIGDRAFNSHTHYKYKYDLALEWKQFTGLPFVFAGWACFADKPKDLFNHLQKALELGVNKIDESIAQVEIPSNIDIKDYLSEKISYRFDDQKKKALELFLGYVSQL